MSIILDIILASVILLTVFGGWRKGFIKTVMGLVTFLIALFGGIHFTPYLAEVYSEKIFSGKIADGISKAIESIIQNGSEIFDLSGLFQEKAFTDVTERFNIDISELDGFVSGSGGVSTSELADRIAQPAAQALSNICAFITLFIAIILLLKLATLILDGIFKLPVLKGLNKFLGLLLGCGLALLYGWVISIVFTAAVPWLAALFPEYIPANAAAAAPLTSFLYNNNLFSGFLM